MTRTVFGASSSIGGHTMVYAEPECLVGGHNRDSIQKRAPEPLGDFIPICMD